MESYEHVGIEHSPELRYDMGFTNYPTTTADGLTNGLGYPEYEWQQQAQETIHGSRAGVYPLQDGIPAQYAPYLGYSNLTPEDMGVVPPPAYIPTGEISFATPLTHLPYSGHENYYAHTYNNISPTSTGSASSGSSNEGRPGHKPKRRRTQNHVQRKAANVRERRRMFHLNEAFDELRKRLPAFNYEKRLSRIETLRLAMTYIAFMKGISDGKDPKDVPLLQMTKEDVLYSDEQDSDV